MCDIHLIQVEQLKDTRQMDERHGIGNLAFSVETLARPAGASVVLRLNGLQIGTQWEKIRADLIL